MLHGVIYLVTYKKGTICQQRHAHTSKLFLKALLQKVKLNAYFYFFLLQ